MKCSGLLPFCYVQITFVMPCKYNWYHIRILREIFLQKGKSPGYRSNWMMEYPNNNDIISKSNLLYLFYTVFIYWSVLEPDKHYRRRERKCRNGVSNIFVFIGFILKYGAAVANNIDIILKSAFLDFFHFFAEVV